MQIDHIYISPLELCNLNCQVCYTKKIKAILTKEKILDFIDRYQKATDLKIITFCGGEVFTLPWFTELINTLTDRGLYLQIITNGTIDKLAEIKNPNSVNLIISIDGLEKYHDKNRGQGLWKTSTEFLKKAQTMGFPVEIFSIVTQENFGQIEEFEKCFKGVPITYHPRKIFGEKLTNVVGFSFITKSMWQKLWATKNVFPPKQLGCFQISLMANGLVYSCCEGPTPIGKITDDIEMIIDKCKMINKCAYPNFMCGICQYRD